MIRGIDRFHMVTPATHSLFRLQELAPARSSTDQGISMIAMVGNYLDAGMRASGEVARVDGGGVLGCFIIAYSPSENSCEKTPHLLRPGRIW